MNLDQLFGELRALLQAPRPPCHATLIALLSQAHALNPARYREQWLPYLGDFSLPPFVVSSLDALNTADAVFPSHIAGRLCISSGLREQTHLLNSGVVELARSQALSRLTHIELSHQYFSDEGMIALCQSEHLNPNLEHLDVSANTIGIEGVLALSQCPAMSSLKTLLLNFNRLHDACARALAASNLTQLNTLELHNAQMTADGVTELMDAPFVSSLRALSLSRTMAGLEGVQVLAQASDLTLHTLKLGELGLDTQAMSTMAESSLLRSVKRLDLWMNQLDYNAIRALVYSDALASVEQLDVSGNDIGIGLTDLVTSPHLSQLKVLKIATNYLWDALLSCMPGAVFQRLETLDLQENILGVEGVSLITQAQWLSSVKCLNLCANTLTSDGVEVLAQADTLCRLEDLNLSENELGDDGVAALTSSKTLNHLKRLVLDANELTDESAQLLAQSPMMSSVQVLSLRDGHISDIGVEALATSPWLKNLRQLDLSQNDLSSDATEMLRSSRLPLGTSVRLEDSGCDHESLIIGRRHV